MPSPEMMPRPASDLQPDLVWMGGKGSPAWGVALGLWSPAPGEDLPVLCPTQATGRGRLSSILGASREQEPQGGDIGEMTSGWGGALRGLWKEAAALQIYCGKVMRCRGHRRRVPLQGEEEQSTRPEHCVRAALRRSASGRWEASCWSRAQGQVRLDREPPRAPGKRRGSPEPQPTLADWGTQRKAGLPSPD